jgi:hypothetical protein
MVISTSSTISWYMLQQSLENIDFQLLWDLPPITAIKALLKQLWRSSNPQGSAKSLTHPCDFPTRLEECP